MSKGGKKLYRIIELLKSWGGEKPDRTHLDFSNANQTEEEYQAEQEKWLKKVRKKKKERSSD